MLESLPNKETLFDVNQLHEYHEVLSILNKIYNNDQERVREALTEVLSFDMGMSFQGKTFKSKIKELREKNPEALEKINSILNRNRPEKTPKVNLFNELEGSDTLSVYPFEKSDISEEGWVVYEDQKTGTIYAGLALSKNYRTAYIAPFAGFKECFGFATAKDLQERGMNFDTHKLTQAMHDIWVEVIRENNFNVSAVKSIPAEVIREKLKQRGIDFPDNKDVSKTENLFREALEEINLKLSLLNKDPNTKITFMGKLDNTIGKTSGFNGRRPDNAIVPALVFTKDENLINTIKAGDDCVGFVLVPIADLKVNRDPSAKVLITLDKTNAKEMINENALKQIKEQFKIDFTADQVKAVKDTNNYVLSHLGAALQKSLKFIIKDKSKDTVSNVKTLIKRYQEILGSYSIDNVNYPNINEARKLLEAYKTNELPNLFGKEGQQFFDVVSKLAEYSSHYQSVSLSLNKALLSGNVSLEYIQSAKKVYDNYLIALESDLNKILDKTSEKKVAANNNDITSTRENVEKMEEIEIRKSAQFKL
ncbi:MAG: hypothetical protein J0H68_03445 [Sphingobacteriia bacterium]|nr:hypothetical protein [Sphingobacteriia bacterium]